MTVNNMMLGRLFTRNVFLNTVKGNNSTYLSVIENYLDNPENKNNKTLLHEIYCCMSKTYRNEYFYQNSLLNKLLLGKHSLNTTTALTQIPISKSKADFILINGKAVVYEIKTELDSFDRLNTQINDYFKAFNHVCVVTSEGQYEKAIELLKNTSVGVYVLTRSNTISRYLRKEPVEDNTHLDHTSIFKVLNKREYESILLEYYGSLPVSKQVFYYDECLNQFSKIPIMEAYSMTLKELKKRNRMRIKVNEFKGIPYELKSLIYFANPSSKEFASINNFLKKEYGG